MTGTDVLAFYGAALSTIIAIVEWRSRRRALKVTVREVREPAVGPGYFVRVDVANEGTRPATVEFVGLEIKGGGTVVLPNEGLPKVLEDGQAYVTRLRSDQVDQVVPVKGQLFQFRAVARDATGRRHVSRMFRFVPGLRSGRLSSS